LIGAAPGEKDGDGARMSFLERHRSVAGIVAAPFLAAENRCVTSITVNGRPKASIRPFDRQQPNAMVDRPRGLRLAALTRPAESGKSTA